MRRRGWNGGEMWVGEKRSRNETTVTITTTAEIRKREHMLRDIISPVSRDQPCTNLGKGWLLAPTQSTRPDPSHHDQFLSLLFAQQIP